MPSWLRAQSIAASDPSRAAHETAAAALGDAPRARPLLVLVASFGAHPGLRPAPWCIEGVARAVGDLGVRARSLVLGSTSAALPIQAQFAARDLPTDDEGGQSLRFFPPGTRRALRVPRHWVGQNLCIVVPCLHRQMPDRGGRAGWQGPIASILAELATRWGGARSRIPVDTLARATSEIFAHISVVIDASWWAPLSARDEGAPLLLAPERMLSACLTSPVSATSAVDPRTLDTWLGRQLGLPMPRLTLALPELVGPAAREPWPTLARTPNPARIKRPGLANQAVTALWRRSAPRPSSYRVALPPAVPGALASLWDGYERPRGTRA